MTQRRAQLSLLLSAVLALGGACSEALTDSSRWERRQAAIDPPELWSVPALDAAAPSHPVKVCADSVVRAGFAAPMPAFDGQACERQGDAVLDGAKRFALCETNGHRFAVTSSVEGDPEQALTVRFSVQPLRGDRTTYGQTLRYQRLGPCPAGWRVGEHTDQHGRRLPSAF